MKRFCYLLSIMLALPLLSCGQSGNKEKEAAGDFIRLTRVNGGTIHPADLLSLADAGKILGEPAHLKDSATTTSGDASTYSCAYTANTQEAKTGKTSVVYFLVEQYFALSSAQKRYSFIKKANENHGIQELSGIGDEAYFHTDRKNFYFIMARKGNRVFNMKVNKITSHTSLDEFNRVAKEIAAAI